MFITKISPFDLENRVDAEYYSPEAIKCLRQVKSFSEYDSLGGIIMQGYRVVYHGTDSTNGLEDEQVLPFLSPSQIDKDGNIDFEKVDVLPIYYKNQYPKGLALQDELLIEVKGNVSKLAIVPKSFPKNLMVSGSLYKAKISSDYDSRFILSFLKCKHGQILKSRLTSNTIISYIAKDDLYSIPVFKVDKLAQTYIGNKVRQAELLREWGKSIENKLGKLEAKIPLEKPVVSRLKHSVATTINLSENRLDAKFYAKQYLDLYSQFSGEFEKLSQITSGFKYGASVKADYVKAGGIPFIRGNAISNGSINSNDLVYFNDKLKDELANCYVKKGDVLITRSGTVGNVSDVEEEFDKSAYGSFVIKCSPIQSEILPEYLSWYLNSWVGEKQFRRLENGAVQQNVNIEELSSIFVWIAGSDFQNNIAMLTFEKRITNVLSNALTKTATLLVESLIEGQITETQLIEAQQSLEEGDNCKDRVILSKLTDKGYLVKDGNPLFADLDKLYELLDEAKAATEADGELG